MSQHPLAPLGNHKSRIVGGKHAKTGIQTGIYQSSPISASASVTTSSLADSKRSFGEGGGITPPKRGRGGGSTTSVSGTLFKNFCNPEARQSGPEAYNRPPVAEQIYIPSTFPYGNSRLHLQSSPDKRMDSFNRFKRCVLPNPNISGSQKISEIRLSGASTTISSALFRDKHCALGFYSRNGGSDVVPAYARDRHSRLSRRSVDSGESPRSAIKSNSNRPPVGKVVRFEDQHGEISSNPFPGIPVPRDVVRHKTRHNASITETVGKMATHIPAVSSGYKPTRSPVGGVARPNDIHARHCTIWPTVCSASTAPCEQKLAQSSRSSAANSHIPTHTGDGQVVALPPQCTLRSGDRALSPVSHDLHGCVTARVGCSLRHSECRGDMVSKRKNDAHQFAGTISCPQRTSALAEPCGTSPSIGSNGQHYGRCIHQQSGGNQVAHSNGPDLVPPIVVSVAQCTHSSSSHTGTTQLHSGQSIAFIERRPDRMATESVGIQTDCSVVEPTVCGPVCDKTQCHVHELCIKCSRPRCVGRGCTDDVMAGVRCVCLPAIRSNTPSPPQDKREQLCNNTDSSSLAQAAVVSNPNITVSGQTSKIATMAQSSHTKKGSGSASVGADPPPSRVAAVTGQLIAQGFSVAAADRIATAVRPSTNKLYASKWGVFVRWCNERSYDPFSASVPVVADFLLHLHQERKVAPRTIEGYRSALSSVFSFGNGPNLTNNMHISALIKNFYESHSKIPSKIPKWNLVLVLKALSKPPFEPMSIVSRLHLTVKTAFLVALATGARVSELNALDINSVAFSQDKSKMWVNTHFDFLAKNQKASSSSDKRGFWIHRLQTDSNDSSSRYLCPLRALKYYMSRTKPDRKLRRKLFIAVRETFSSEISSQTVARWIKSAIKMAYAESTAADLRDTKVTAHEVRALAASQLYLMSGSVDAVKQACYWKSDNTFCKYYLRDMTACQGDMRILRPVIPGAI